MFRKKTIKHLLRAAYAATAVSAALFAFVLLSDAHAPEEVIAGAAVLIGGEGLAFEVFSAASILCENHEKAGKILTALEKNSAVRAANASAEERVRSDGWLCPACGVTNSEYNQICWKCASKREAEVSDQIKL